MTRIEAPIAGVDYHQFYVMAEGVMAYGDTQASLDYPRSPSYPGRLLAAVDSTHGVCVSTGIAMGTIVLAIDLLEHAPAALDATRNWEAISEVSVEATRTWAEVQFLQTYPAEVPDSFSRLELTAGAGRYRVRGHAVGRALDFDMVVSSNIPERSTPREFHLLQFWPEDSPSEHVRIRDDDPWAGRSEDKSPGI